MVTQGFRQRLIGAADAVGTALSDAVEGDGILRAAVALEASIAVEGERAGARMVIEMRDEVCSIAPDANVADVPKSGLAVLVLDGTEANTQDDGFR